MTGLWHWEDDHGGFQPYNAQISAQIEAAFLAGNPTAQITVPQAHRVATYDIDFQASTQVNSQTGFERGLYRSLGPGAAGPLNTWNWQDDYGGVVPMDRETCSYLDVMKGVHNANNCYVCTANLTQYLVDFLANTQQNTGSGRVRQIRMVPNQGQAQGAPAAAANGGGTNSVVDGVMARCINVTTTVGEDDACTICHDDFTAASPALKLPSCAHFFHGDCVKQWLVRSSKCPVCSFQYASTIGNMPPGTMDIKRYAQGRLSLGGYEQYGTILITYSFNGGTQTQEHPHPGRRYGGTRRACYLPDNDVGKKLLGLLQRAFNQKLIFTIGRSLTTGVDDSIVWVIHHKTSATGGVTHHGYPDPTYLTRLRAELKLKGIE